MGNPFDQPKAPPPPKPVKIPGPTPMPAVDQTRLNQSKKKVMAAASQRSGRASTILTDSSGKLGA